MKFLCDACGAKYVIDDAKVRGKILTIRCKKCSNAIKVRAPREAGPDVAKKAVRATTALKAIDATDANSNLRRRLASTAPAAPKKAAALAPAPEPAEEPWYYSVNGETFGPYSEDELLNRFQDGKLGDEAYVWQQGFAEWLPATKVMVFSAVIDAAKASKRRSGAPRTMQLDAIDVDSTIDALSGGLAQSGTSAPAEPAAEKIQATGPKVVQEIGDHERTIVAEGLPRPADAVGRPSFRSALQTGSQSRVPRPKPLARKPASPFRLRSSETPASIAPQPRDVTDESKPAVKPAAKPAKTKTPVVTAPTPAAKPADITPSSAPSAPKPAQPSDDDLGLAAMFGIDESKPESKPEVEEGGFFASLVAESKALSGSHPAAGTTPVSAEPDADVDAPEQVRTTPAVTNDSGAERADDAALGSDDPATSTDDATDLALVAATEADIDRDPFANIGALPVLEAGGSVGTAVEEGPSKSLLLQVNQASSSRKYYGIIALVLVIGLVAFVATRGGNSDGSVDTNGEAVSETGEPVAEGTTEPAQEPVVPELTPQQQQRLRENTLVSVRSAGGVIHRSIDTAIGEAVTHLSVTQSAQLAEMRVQQQLRDATQRDNRRDTNPVVHQVADSGQNNQDSESGAAAPEVVRDDGTLVPQGSQNMPGRIDTSRNDNDGPGSDAPPAEHFAAGLRSFIQDSIERCNQRHVMAEGPLPQQRITLEVEVQPSGRVSDVSVDREIRGTSFANCLESHRGRWLFERFESSESVILQRTYVVQ